MVGLDGGSGPQASPVSSCLGFLNLAWMHVDFGMPGVDPPWLLMNPKEGRMIGGNTQIRILCHMYLLGLYDGNISIAWLEGDVSSIHILANLHSHCPSEGDDILLTWAVVVLICVNCDASGLKPILVCKYYNSVHRCSLGGCAQHAKWLADGRLLFGRRSTSSSVSSASVSGVSSRVLLFKLMAILIIVKSRWVKCLPIAWVALWISPKLDHVCIKCMSCEWQFFLFGLSYYLIVIDHKYTLTLLSHFYPKSSGLFYKWAAHVGVRTWNIWTRRPPNHSTTLPLFSVWHFST